MAAQTSSIKKIIKNYIEELRNHLRAMQETRFEPAQSTYGRMGQDDDGEAVRRGAHGDR